MMNKEIRKLQNSFQNAFRGVAYCIAGERNMRIHLVTAFYLYLFSGFYGFTRAEYIQLSLAIGLVLAAEALNTAIEALVDIISPTYSNTARVVKDIAAGVVLIAAIFAFVVGVLLYGRPEVIRRIGLVMLASPGFVLGLVVTLVPAWLFIFHFHGFSRR